MNNAEAVNWLINITADIGKIEHQDLWHYEQALSEIREMLEDAHTIEPRTKGVWINDCCSICGYGVEPWNNTPYCPNCGADMKGEENESN